MWKWNSTHWCDDVRRWVVWGTIVADSSAPSFPPPPDVCIRMVIHNQACWWGCDDARYSNGRNMSLFCAEMDEKNKKNILRYYQRSGRYRSWLIRCRGIRIQCQNERIGMIVCEILHHDTIRYHGQSWMEVPYIGKIWLSPIVLKFLLEVVYRLESRLGPKIHGFEWDSSWTGTENDQKCWKPILLRIELSICCCFSLAFFCISSLLFYSFCFAISFNKITFTLDF